MGSSDTGTPLALINCFDFLMHSAYIFEGGVYSGEELIKTH